MNRTSSRPVKLSDRRKNIKEKTKCKLIKHKILVPYKNWKRIISLANYWKSNYPQDVKDLASSP